ncbi:MAG: hypothetical protein K0R57_5562 [Paenibacillaceae bacterium]|jgi:hypothetical protein|nr:hypothetical protein [Paenibacillaceae bacterium]
MKEILATILLLAAALLIYISTIGGEGRMEENVQNGGGRVHAAIERLNP